MNAAGVMPPAPSGPPATQPTILVVDDEVLVRLAVAEYLRDCGFRVLEAATAEEAVTILTATLGIDLVFSDVRMPGEMDGFALARWIRDNRPEIRMLLTSGYPGGDSRTRAQVSDVPVLDKPYNYDMLEQQLRTLLKPLA